MTSIYSKTNPFHAKIIDRYCLNKGPSDKQVWHIVLDVEGSDINYTPGDAIGVYPDNDPSVVSALLDHLSWDPDTQIEHPREKVKLSIREYLTSHVDFMKVSRPFLKLIADYPKDGSLRIDIEDLLDPSQREKLKSFLASHHLIDVLDLFDSRKAQPQDFCNALMRLFPRFYSIASCLDSHPNQIHLTVKQVDYELNLLPRKGVCSHYLINQTNLHDPVVPIFVQHNEKFSIPDHHATPMIMIGPGTGIAPFVGFMQARAKQQAQKNWLFFGECYKDKDFYYEDLWSECVQQGILDLETAFSRDQAHKVYVQDKLLENGSAVWDWIEAGARIYICGDAQRMAKGVQESFLRIAQNYGALSEADAKEWLKQMRRQGRYITDVY